MTIKEFQKERSPCVEGVGDGSNLSILNWKYINYLLFVSRNKDRY